MKRLLVFVVVGLLVLPIAFVMFFGGRSEPELDLASNNPCGNYQTGWVAPMAAQYHLTSGYGGRRNPTGRGGDFHTGQDLAGPPGAKVVAASAGTVTRVVDLGKRSFGKYIVIQHLGDTKTFYAHLSQQLVKVNQKVSAGQVIGVQGSTGRSTGPHLHFEVRVNGSTVNPVKWLSSQGLSLDGSASTAVRTPAVTPNLSREQLQNATLIINVGQQMGVPQRGLVIAVATAMQESSLKNINHGDRDSLGLFQQRPSQGWGTPGQIMDPKYAAKRFYTGLLKVRGWQTMSLTKAAQSVQRSAFPNAYAKHEKLAASIVSIRSGNTECAQPLAGNSAGEKAANAALKYLGTPYSWGGGGVGGPSKGICCSPGGHDARRTVGFDCSGLSQYAWWAATGIKIPRTARKQHKALVDVPRNQIQAGDLLFFKGSMHVGIADGKGGMIHAPRSNKNVEVVPNVLSNKYWSRHFAGAARPRLKPKA